MKRSYIHDTFTLSKEHVQLSKIAGLNHSSLIDQYLVNIEIDLKIKPNSLVVYFMEQYQEYYKYWYTEGDNIRFIRKFENTIFSFSRGIESILN